MSRHLVKVIGTVLTLGASAAQSSPIYLKPGQCILVGSQEVCAMQGDSPTANKVAQDVVHVCRYAMNPGAEISNIKNYAVVRITTTVSGAKSDTILKQFGISDGDKAACEAEVERLNAAAIKP